ncbi:hypothetical protein SASC598O02_008690 [Snodgrassella alvi SCGC AB-598-O02]|nr:hypothetical protein SASC598O02_008690 [Snodgrassella alvi SCGC AB-598-O02]
MKEIILSFNKKRKKTDKFIIYPLSDINSKICNLDPERSKLIRDQLKVR